jgi:hypothetical protein
VQRALEREPGPFGTPDHRRVAGQRVDLQPVQAADGEAELAQRQDHVAAQAAPAERRPQRQAEVRRTVVQVDGPQQGRARQVAVGQFDHGEQGEIVAGVTDRVGRRG